jgi:crotonobetainyl-CoA:carnitine CoA-transferase CaiB-like acyl-CoA transferase
MTPAAAFPGLRVLELTTTIAGPYCGMILGTLGADVVKVERPGVGDDARAMPPRLGKDSSVFHAVNAGKRSLVLDLREPDGRDAFLRLATSADVVVQNFKPGTAEALGVGYDDVRARNPAIVYCSISAFGSSGSGAALPGYDPIVQAFCGLISMTGEPEGNPVRVAASLIDLTTGMWAALGITAALQRRSRTGDGEHVEVALVDSGFALLCHQILGMYATGLVPERLGSASPITAPYECFQTQDGWVMIAAGNDRAFLRLCAVLDLRDVADEARFQNADARVQNRADLHALLEKAISLLSTTECIARLARQGVPAAPVQDLRQAVDHPLTAERGLIRPAVGGGDKGLPQVRLPIEKVRSPRAPDPPQLGQHSREVLEEAGFTAEEIASLGVLSGARPGNSGV